MEETMGNLLRFGVFLSAAVVLIGGVLYLLHHSADNVGYHQFFGERTGLGNIFAAAFRLEPAGIIGLGVILLIATPVARVLYALMSFVRERDRRFVVITLIVAAVLLYGFLGGKA